MRTYDNDIFLRKVRGEQTERPPVWLMRQAGRILPQYRAVRASLSGFIELVTTPDLVAEVTIQPVDELDVDAAIIFSDILVIPECMGLEYEMIEKKGPNFPETIQSLSDIEKLDSGKSAAEKLEYVFNGLDITKRELKDRVPLIGFSGAPFTLFCYMVEGSGSKTFSKAKKMLYQNPEAAHLLLSKLTDTIIEYTKLKAQHGADVIQIFDSWAGVLNEEMYRTFCIPYIKKINDALQAEDIPTIVFSKGAWYSLKDIASIGSNVIGIDWNMGTQFVRDTVGSDRVVQGNLDPCVLYAPHDEIESRTKAMIQAFGGNHIVNLGHGVYPDTPLDGVKAFVNTVKSYSY
ncbi:MAG: uroporphyrinogen decarboxylase [Saprospiraceae bacterium]|nr:uroporphyrinogen decarboxylase [Saprospiraceae bacterium]